MLPDGSYRMSQTQAAEIVGLNRRNVFDFLRSNAIKSLLGEGYTGSISDVEIESEGQARGGSRINALPLEVVSAYWLWQAYRGNKQALTLCMGLILETLERRFDNAFGVSRSESERDHRLNDRLYRLEQDLEKLGEGFAFEDLVRQERDHYEKWFSDRGINPWEVDDPHAPPNDRS
jgi:hypothetical protein